jgi:leader peptidase (prepilin peptidase) / N-methyltransferase
MLEVIAVLCIILALALLAVLSYIDLKIQLLPNEYVLSLACCGFVFHLATMFHYESISNIAIGAFVGGGLLFVIRGAANYWYGEDTLGLGDVKLLAAGGIWLGPEHILIAAAAGALAGFLHGLGVAVYTVGKAKVPMDFSKLSVPAGPGFAVGMIAVAIYKFYYLPAILLP